MSKALMAVLGIAGVVFIGLVILIVMVISTLNSEARLRNQIGAKQKDNTSQLDNTIKVITQNAQVTTEQREALKDIIVGNATARAGQGGGSLATMVSEAVPNMDQTTATYRQLMNTITAARNEWTTNQRALLDLKREHDNLIDTQPSGLILSLFGKQKIDVIIVTSTRTDESFKTGKDDDTDLFPAKK